MISSVARWFGRHPVTCLVPVLLYGAIAIVEFAARWGGKSIMQPFGNLALPLLVLAALAILIAAAAMWVNNQNADRSDRLADQLDDRLDRIEAGVHAELSLIRDLLEQPRHRTSVVVRRDTWNANTQVNMGLGAVYGKPYQPAIAHEDVPPLDEQIRALGAEEPPTGEVRR